MKRKLFYLLVAIITLDWFLPGAVLNSSPPSALAAGPPPVIDWLRQFGSGSPSGGTFVYDVASDIYGNAYMVGSTYGDLPGQISSGSADLFIRKYGNLGNELWTHQFGTGSGEEASSVAVDSLGNAYVVGYTDGTLPGQTKIGDIDAFIRKYDTSGNDVWTRQFGTINGDHAFGVAVDSAGNVYVAGDTMGAFPNYSSSGGYDGFLREYDSSGTELWTRQFGTVDSDCPRDVAVDGAGNAYLVGYIQGDASFGFEDAVTWKYDAFGNQQWVRRFDTGSADFNNKVSADASGNIYVVGNTMGTLPNQTSSGDYDAFVRKYDGSGTELWTRQFGTSAGDFAEGVAVDNLGNVNITGTTLGTMPGETSLGQDDAFTRKYDSLGNEIQTYQYGTASSDTAHGIAAGLTSDLYVVGETYGTFAGQISSGQRDVYIIKFTTNGSPAPQQGTLRIVKNTIGGDGTFSFSIPSANWTNSITTFNGTGSVTIPGLAADNYTVAEGPLPAGWVANGPMVVYVSVPAGGTSTYTFSNTYSGNTTAPTTVQVNNGTTINLPVAGNMPNIPVTIKNIPNLGAGNGMGSFQLNLGWNPAVANVTGVTMVTIPGYQLLAGVPNNTTGTVTIVGYWNGASSYLTGDLTVAHLDISAVGSAGSSTYITVNSILVSDKDRASIPATAVNAQVNIVPAQGTLTIVKNTIGGDGTFNFTVSGSNWTSSQSVTTFNGTGSVTIPGLTAGNYAVTEGPLAVGWAPTANTSTVKTVAVTSNGSATVTFSNTYTAPPTTATLTILKNTVGGDGTFTFSIPTANWTGSITTVNGTGSVTIPGLAAGNYTVMEGPLPTGWTASGPMVQTAYTPSNSKLVFLRKWGSYGTGDGQFDAPTAIAVSSSGDVYVTDTHLGRVQKFDATGDFAAKWGGLSWPFGIAVDSSGDVYVGDTFNHRVVKFYGNGGYVEWGSYGTGDGQFQYPKGIAIDASGYVYVVDSANNRIQKFTSDGSFVTKWGSAGSNEGQFNWPEGIAIDAYGNVVVADVDNNRIQVFTGSGAFITEWGSYGSGDGQFAFPEGLAADRWGNIYVADSMNYRIEKFTSTGQFILKWGTIGTGDGEFDYPVGIAVDTSGNVYVADYGNHRIEVFGPGVSFSNIYSPPPALGSLTIVKNTIGGDGTFSFSIPSANWTSSITTFNGTGSVTIPGLTAGNYTVAEGPLPAGWAPTANTSTVKTVAVTGNVSATVTFSNTYTAPPTTATLTIIKNTVGGDGTFNFTVSGSNWTSSQSVTTFNGTGSVTIPSLTAGNYTVAEGPLPAGWAPTANTSTVKTVAVTGNGTATVTFSNTFVPPPAHGTLTIIKNTIGGDGTFNFTLSGPSQVPPQSITTFNGSGSVTIPALVVGNYSIAESSWSTGWMPVPNDPVKTVFVTVNGSATITFTNIALNSLTIIKHTVGGDGTFNFAISGPSPVPVAAQSITTFNGTGSVTIPSLMAGNYIVTEVSLPPGWIPTANGSTTKAVFVTANGTGIVSFSNTFNTYTLTYTAGSGGTITGTSPQTVAYGANGTLVTAVPNTGYHFVNWSDGLATASRTDLNVTADKSVTANFAINTYTITASAGPNGSITPSGAVSVNYGASQTFAMAPNTGCQTVDVKVDGISIGPVATYVFSNVSTDHTIAVTFVATTPGGKITGGVLRFGNDGRGGFNVQSDSKGGVKGELEYQNGSVNLHASTMTAIAVSLDQKQGWFAGTLDDGRKFNAYVEDNGEPGTNDVFKLWVDGLLQNGDGKLTGGNIQVHK